MELYPHTNYRRYVKWQRLLTEKKTEHGTKLRSWVDEAMINNINRLIHIHTREIKNIVCHGCRNGLEVNLLQDINPGVIVYGTDIYNEAYMYDRKYFRNIDFDTIPEEWLGYFDVVYSNSIDHSRDPVKTLTLWGMELKDSGICYVSFYWGRGVSKQDCFQLDRNRPMEEISEISKQIGMNVVYISEAYFDNYSSHIADVIFKKENS